MKTVIYKARSRSELFKIRDHLKRAGIESTIVGDPDMSPAPGTKVYYLVELAVDVEDVPDANQIISEHQAAGEERILHLTMPIRRVAGFVLATGVLLGAFGLIFSLDLMMSAITALFILALVALSLAATKRSWTRERRKATGQCIECGYSLRGSRSGRCPECGEKT